MAKLSGYISCRLENGQTVGLEFDDEYYDPTDYEHRAKLRDRFEKFRDTAQQWAHEGGDD